MKVKVTKAVEDIMPILLEKMYNDIVEDDVVFDNAPEFIQHGMKYMKSIEGKTHKNGKLIPTKEKVDKDEKKVATKAPNSWIIFTRMYRKKYPDKSFTASELSDIWKNQMTDEEKEVYIELANEEKDKLLANKNDSDENEDNSTPEDSDSNDSDEEVVNKKKKTSQKKNDSDEEVVNKKKKTSQKKNDSDEEVVNKKKKTTQKKKDSDEVVKKDSDKVVKKKTTNKSKKGKTDISDEEDEDDGGIGTGMTHRKNVSNNRKSEKITMANGEVLEIES